jgi:hypothetical protein
MEAETLETLAAGREALINANSLRLLVLRSQGGMKTARPREQAVKRVHGMPFGANGRGGMSAISGACIPRYRP